MSTDNNECCPKFNPEGWDGGVIVWKDKLFLKDRVWSLFHIPLNFGSVMARAMDRIENAAAKSEMRLVVSDECSLWYSDVYVEVTKVVLGAQMATLKGTYISKVYEGPYSHMGKWIRDIKTYVEFQGKPVLKLLFYYTTCPICAKKYGKNYVVILAQIE